MQGWIGLHRKLMENPVWVDPNYLKLWIYCLFKASHKPHKHLVGNQLVELERGQFITGRDSLAEDMNKGLKPKQKLDGLTWFRYLKNMEKWEMLNIKTNNKFSVVTVVKYEVYQHNEVEVEQQLEQQLNNKRTTNEQQMNTNNNVNKGNNENNEKKNTLLDAFNEFWEVYPKKADKKKATEKFLTVCKKHKPEIVINGAKAYANECRLKKTDKQYIKNATTFLNAESFLNDYETGGADGKNTNSIANEYGLDF